MVVNIKKIGIFSTLISFAFVLSGCFHTPTRKEPPPLKRKPGVQRTLPGANEAGNTNANVVMPKKVENEAELDSLLNDLEKTEEPSDSPAIDDSDIDNF